MISKQTNNPTHHFLHADIVGEQLGDYVSIGQKHVADSLEKQKHEEQIYVNILLPLVTENCT